MAEQLQLRQGTTAQHAVFTGAVAEITVDTDKDVVVVHDGTTAGGHPLAKQSSVDLKANDNTVVKLTGDQSVAGIKTFTSIPILPAVSPTTDNQATRKKYVDDGLALKTGIGTATPLEPAVTAVVGTSTLAARQDHIHPTNFTSTATDIKMNGTQAVGTLTTYPRADHVHPTDTSRAPLASPTFTGTPAAPTASTGTNTTQIATTAFVNAEIANDTYVKDTANWRDTMMSKAEFNAVAAERRANRAGSGFDEWGKHYSITSTNPTVNEGIWTVPSTSNTFCIGRDIDSIGISKTRYPMGIVNGTVLKIEKVNVTNVAQNNILLPTAPNIYPYDTVLTAEQIASGVIKHADASNSGLIVNGKFDTDTSGWTANNAILSVLDGKLVVSDNGTYSVAKQTFTTIIGKKYIFEFEITNNTDGTFIYGVHNSSVWSGADSTNIAYDASQVISTIGSTRKVIEFTATSTTTMVIVGQVGTVPCLFDNIAVFPADAISRSDLVFLESWHEDVSEKDFVYPLGNVQYLGTTGDAGTPVAGAFAGSATYSLFSDTWQADGALVGKGYVWSTLSDANKKAFVANPENNCYLDGDKVIQVRYRMRVVMGWGDSWTNVDTQAINFLANQTGVYVRPKGKLVVTTQADSGYGADTNGVFGNKNVSWTNLLSWNGDGHFAAADAYGDTNGFTAGSYNGQVFALPIALVHRRNQGGYNATYNPNGTKTMTMTPANISDCFNPANYTAATGYIGTSTSRPDGLFYDQVSVEDFKPTNKGADLRATSKKRTASSIIEEFAPKVIAGTIPYYTNDTTALTTYKDFMEVRDTSGNRYPMKNKIGNVVTIQQAVSNKKGFSVVTQNGKQWLQVADDATNDDTVQMNASVVKYDIGVFDAV